MIGDNRGCYDDDDVDSTARKTAIVLSLTFFCAVGQERLFVAEAARAFVRLRRPPPAGGSAPTSLSRLTRIPGGLLPIMIVHSHHRSVLPPATSAVTAMAR
eukprot:1752533-Rhodomonas_salina.1